jgi:hypothetical protein
MATTTWAPTTEQILDLDGVRHRRDAFRFELCDKELSPIGELHPDEQTTPSIENENDSSRRLSNFKLTADEAADVNPLRDRLRVYMTLQNGAEYRLGTFLWADNSRPARSWGLEQQSSLVDLGFILNQPCTNAFGWSKGANIMLIMFFLLNRAGFELSDIAVIGSEAARGLRDPRSWEPGTTWADMINDMGAGCGFAPVWFDRNGKAHLDQAPDPSVDEPTVSAYEAGTRVIADSIVHTDDYLAAANAFAVYDSGTDRLRSGRYDIPASAPHSYANRGFRIGRSESVQGLENQDLATRAARNLARRSDVFEYVTFNSTADPRHETYDIVDAFGDRWLEVSWSLELRSGGAMSHSLKRVSYDVI